MLALTEVRTLCSVQTLILKCISLMTYSYFQLRQSRVISSFRQPKLSRDSCYQLELGRQERTLRETMMTMTMCLQQRHAPDMSSLCLVPQQASMLRFRSLACCHPLLSTCRALGNTSLYPRRWSCVVRWARRDDARLACSYLYWRRNGCTLVMQARLISDGLCKRCRRSG